MLALHRVHLQHPVDAVAGGLRLARDNGDFLATSEFTSVDLPAFGRPGSKQTQNEVAYPLVSTIAARTIGITQETGAHSSKQSVAEIHDEIEISHRRHPVLHGWRKSELPNSIHRRLVELRSTGKQNIRLAHRARHVDRTCEDNNAVGMALAFGLRILQVKGMNRLGRSHIFAAESPKTCNDAACKSAGILVSIAQNHFSICFPG